ncbi:hypothetical protein DIZ76_016034 [Coccidioides immitis]|nr:hypothetical protein DIZ76_016034 [Coccidioides immitis]
MIAGLKFIYVSCEALKCASASRMEYLALRTEIQSLLTALEAIDDLDLEYRGTEKQWTAVNSSISSCKACIDDFLAKTSKYEPYLQDGAKRGWAAGYRRIKWAICKREDVAQFRMQLERHASSINMLLITFQAHAADKPRDARTAGGMAIVARPGTTDDENITALLKGLTLEQRQFFQLLLTQNRQLQQSLDDIRHLVRLQTEIPPQVTLQKPVILLDAFGKTAPFHLDFIDSLDAFVAVLKIRSEQAGVRMGGLKKLDRREFCIRDTQRRRSLDLNRPWTKIFRPGQNVDMSMVFRRRLTPTICPECGCQNDPCVEDGEIECGFCGLWYHHVREEPHAQPLLPPEPDPAPLSRTVTARSSEVDSSELDVQEPKFAGFRRVRIISLLLNPSTANKRSQDVKPDALRDLSIAQRSPLNMEDEPRQSYTRSPPQKKRNIRMQPPFPKTPKQKAHRSSLKGERLQLRHFAEDPYASGEDSSSRNNPLEKKFRSHCWAKPVFSHVSEEEGTLRPRSLSAHGHQNQEQTLDAEDHDGRRGLDCDIPGFRMVSPVSQHLRLHDAKYEPAITRRREEVQWTLIDSWIR